jgi:DHA2 family multidrug resistance protein
MHARISESVTPFNNALQFPDVVGRLDVNTEAGRAMLDALVTQQASVIAYQNDFKLLMYLTLAVIPLVFVLGTSRQAPRRSGAQQPAAPAHALD